MLLLHNGPEQLLSPIMQQRDTVSDSLFMAHLTAHAQKLLKLIDVDCD